MKTRHKLSLKYCRCLILCMLIIVAVLTAGCSRQFYRRQADIDAYSIIQQKTCAPDWPLDGYTTNVNSSSRMFDPNSIDFPPMPPDDPTAHKYMHCVDGKKGWPGWHANGDTEYVENPSWEQNLPRCPSGNTLIDEPTAMCLALLHSPTYQKELEDLYLSALDVSFERFRFQTQFFGGESLTFTADGRDRNGTGESSSVLDLSTRSWQSRKLFSAGGELVVGLANSILWQFAGPTTNATNTLLDFSFVQPLLRRGGRDFILERLTLAERVLLGNVRLMERFRGQFYLQVLTGTFANGGPQRRGGVFGGSGLEGFSGVGGGGFGQLNIFGGGFQGGNGGFAGGAGAGQAGGFLGLVQLQQNIRNQQANVAALESSVSQLAAFFRADRIDYFQVELARQALFNAQSLLLNSRLAYENQKDSFKQTLGLPPHIIIEIDDSLIQAFQLIGADAIGLQNELTQIQRQLGEAVIGILSIEDNQTDTKDPAARLDNEQSVDSNDEAEQDAADTGSSNTRLDRALEQLGHAENLHDSQRSPSTDRIRAASYAQPIDASASDDHQLINHAVGVGEDEEIGNTAVGIKAGKATESRPEATTGADLKRQLETIRKIISRADGMCNTIIADQMPATRKDIDKLQQTLSGRQSQMMRLRRLIEAQIEEEAETCGDDPPPAVDVDAIIPFDPERLEKLPQQLTQTSDDIKARIEEISRQLAALDSVIDKMVETANKGGTQELYKQLSQQLLATAPDTLNELSANLLGIILVQVRARTQNAELVPVELDWREAVDIAREHRLDWMNARASLVDSWRLIQFNSDALQSNLDFIFSGDVGSVGDNPLDLRGSKGRLRVGVQFDAPLTRLAERNTYRQALIEYQQARRSFYQFQDQVTTDLRTILRGLRVNQVNFELRRAAVEVAIAQVELARLRLQEPPKPEQEAALGATTARDLVSALSDLLNVQNDFLSVWINHESLRRSLDLSLGTMQLDNCGVWIDPGPILRLSDDDPSGSLIEFDGNGMLNNNSAIEPLPRNVLPVDDQNLEELPREGSDGNLLPTPPQTNPTDRLRLFDQSIRRLPSEAMLPPRSSMTSSGEEPLRTIQPIAPYAGRGGETPAVQPATFLTDPPSQTHVTGDSVSLFRTLTTAETVEAAVERP